MATLGGYNDSAEGRENGGMAIIHHYIWTFTAPGGILIMYATLSNTKVPFHPHTHFPPLPLLIRYYPTVTSYIPYAPHPSPPPNAPRKSNSSCVKQSTTSTQPKHQPPPSARLPSGLFLRPLPHRFRCQNKYHPHPHPWATRRERERERVRSSWGYMARGWRRGC